MSDVEHSLSELESETSTIEFKTVKASSFATYGADGAMGSLTPKGYINVNFYIERAALPDSIIHAVSDEGLGKVVEVKGGGAIVRELQCALLLDGSAASDLHAWLGRRMEELAALRKTSESSESKDDSQSKS